MEYRDLGRSGLRTAPLIFGGNVFGWTLDEQASFAMIDAWLDAGFNMIDTADVYSKWVDGHAGGESETVLGRYFHSRGNRADVVLASKVGMQMPGQGSGLSRDHIMASVEASLQRLQTDWLDLYFAHTDDSDTPLDETLEAFDRLIADGKVRSVGASNYEATRLTRALEVSTAHGVSRYEVLQPSYNLYDRSEFEGALQTACQDASIGVTPYFSLASGFLTGKYRSREDARGAAREALVDRYFDDRGMRILDALDAVAAERDATPAAVSLAWLMVQPGVTAPIVSATSPSQLEQLVAATRIQLSDADVQHLADASDRAGSS